MKSKVSFVLSFLIYLSSCGLLDIGDLEPNSNKNSKLAENVYITTQQSETNLLVIDSTKLVFRKEKLDTEDLEVGDIIISDMTDLAPNGYLRKIVSIQDDGSELTLLTEQARLTEAYEELHIDYSYTIDKSDIELLDTSGIDITSRSNEIIFTFNAKLYDRDGRSATKYDQIKVDGEVGIKLDAKLDWDIANFKLDTFEFSYFLDNRYDLNFNAGGELGAIEPEGIVLATFKLAPFTVPGTPIPIAKQWIVLVLSGSGEINVELEASASCNLTGAVGIKYNRDLGWSEIYENNSGCSINPPTLGGDVSAKVELQARYEIRPFGLKKSRIFLGTKGYAKAEISWNFGDPVVPWKLYWGVDMFGMAQMQVFNSAVVNYEREVNLYEDIIGEGELPIANTLVDPRDGQEYKTKSFNGRTWMIENLNYETSFSICNDCNSYGRLYLFQDAAETICPNGWSVPSKEAVEELDAYLKENDAFEQFKLQKGGAAVNDNGRIGFLNEGLTDYFWTEIRDGDLWTLVYSITNNLDTDIYGIERRVRNYYSCRCIKD